MEKSPERRAARELQAVGLTEYEARCFVALSRVPKATAKEVSQLADVPRSRVYDSAENLQARGLVDVREGTPREFRAVSVNLAVEKLEREYLDHLESVAASLREVSRASSTREPSEIWTIEGRANVVDRGLTLFEEATSELFVMVTGDDLLEDAWVEGMAEAADRGATVLFGCQCEDICEDVRERVPEVSIWGPEANVPEFPTDGDRLARLVMADREAVMIATLGGQGFSGATEETAVWGRGTTNGLVVVLEQMLGARIDELEPEATDSAHVQL